MKIVRANHKVKICMIVIFMFYFSERIIVDCKAITV